MKGERESFDNAERCEIIWGQDSGGHRNRSRCLEVYLDVAFMIC